MPKSGVVILAAFGLSRAPVSRHNGQQFLFVTSTEETSVTPFTVVLNWMSEMKK